MGGKALKVLVVFHAEDKTIGIIGAGHLGSRVIEALYEKGHRKIAASRRNSFELEKISGQYLGIETFTDNAEAAQYFDIIVLAVKPAYVDDVAREIKEYSSGKLVVSLAAAKSMSGIFSILGDARIARVMTGVFAGDEVAAYSILSGNGMYSSDKEMLKYMFGENAVEVGEEILANRTFIACDTGLTAKAIDDKVKKLAEHGMNAKDANVFYAAMLESIAKNLRKGMTGSEIYENAAGPNSFTEKIYGIYREKGLVDVVNGCIGMTIEKCRQK